MLGFLQFGLSLFGFICLALSIVLLVRLWQAFNDLEESKVTQQLTLREIKMLNQNLQELTRALRVATPEIDTKQP